MGSTDSYFDHGYDYGDFGGTFGSSEIMAVFGVFLGLMMISVLFKQVINAVLYILRSIGLYRLSENRGMSGAALAWIPFVGFFRIGSVADDIVARNGGRSYYRYILLVGGIVNALGGIASWVLVTVSGAFSQLFSDSYGLYGPYGYNGGYYGHNNSLFAYWGAIALLSLISIAVLVVTIIALNKIYQCYRPMSATLWTILSVFFPFMQSIFPFVLRNAAPADQWNAQGYYPAPNQNWQAPQAQYPPYGQQPPMNGGYPLQNQNWQQPPPPPENDSYPLPANNSYQPPVAPNPPEPWETESSVQQPLPKAPWDENNGDS